MTDTTSHRHRHAPQLRDYDSKAISGVWWAPYVMFHCGFPNAVTASVTIDGFGVRNTVGAEGELLSPETMPSYDLNGRTLSVVVGGSTAFGVGATSDATTIASVLNRMTGSVWLNLGMRSWVLSQNLIQMIFLRQRLRNLATIVLLSGLNELDIYMISNVATLPYGPIYGWREFFSRMNTEFHDDARGQYDFPTNLGRMLSGLPRFPDGQDVFVDLLDNCFAGWSMFARDCGARIVFCLQPVHHWHRRLPSAEERDIMAERFLQYPDNERLFDEERQAYGDWYADTLRHLSLRHGFGFADLNEVIDVPELDGRFLFVDPWHLTDEGTEIVARAIADLSESPPER